MKTQASDADKLLIESVIVKLTLEGKVVNKPPPQDLASFYNPTNVIDNIQHGPSQNHSINSCNINSSILSETSLSTENNLQTPIREISVSNSEIPENQIYI